MKKKILAILMLTVLISCSKDNNDSAVTSIDGVFIGINNDNRIPGLNDIGDTYRIDIESHAFGQSYNEPAGVQVVMEIWDKNREFIGGIGGVNSCQVIEAYIDVFRRDFNGKTQIETYSENVSKEEKQDKCRLFFRLKDINRNGIFTATADSGQNITVEYKNGEYYVEWKNINFTDGYGKGSFTSSGRIITN